MAAQMTNTSISATRTIVAAAGWSEKTRAMAQRAAQIAARQGARGVLAHVYVHGLVQLLRGLPRAGQARFNRERLDELAELIHGASGFRFEVEVHAAAGGRERALRRLVDGASLAVFDAPQPWSRDDAWPRAGELGCPALIVKREPEGDYRRVLVLADHPAEAAGAVAQARALAPEAELVLLSVLDRSVENRLRSRGAGEGAIRQALQQRREQAYAALDGLAGEGAEVSKVVEQGHLPMLLRHTEERLGADLLVLGRQTRRGLPRYLLRDLVSEAAAGSGCDVLLLPGRAQS